MAFKKFCFYLQVDANKPLGHAYLWNTGVDGSDSSHGFLFTTDDKTRNKITNLSLCQWSRSKEKISDLWEKCKKCVIINPNRILMILNSETCSFFSRSEVKEIKIDRDLWPTLLLFIVISRFVYFIRWITFNSQFRTK